MVMPAEKHKPTGDVIRGVGQDQIRSVSNICCFKNMTDRSENGKRKEAK